MVHVRLFLLIALTLVFTDSICGQNNAMPPPPPPPPPPPAMPTSINEKIIDEIIVVSGYEVFYKAYVFEVIETTAKEKNWSDEKIKAKKNLVNFAEFKSTIYNAFAFYNTDELELLKKLYDSLSKRKKNNKMVMMNSMIQHNLVNHLSRYLKD
jgi:hypothetical protein